MAEVQIRQAKSEFSGLVDRAIEGEPQIITRHGHRVAVLVSWEEWERLSNVPSFAKLLLSAPIEESDIPERDRTPHDRQVEF
jgi:prevent-host-death family protein